MYGNFVVANNYCSPTTNQFPHLFIFCTVLYLSRVGCPRGTSHQKPKALWAAVDCKKILQSILLWLVGDNFCGIESLASNYDHDYVFVITYALNEVVTIFEVWVQNTSTLVKKRIAKITEPICLWSPVTKVQVPWGCISFCLLFISVFWFNNCFF